MQGELLWFNEVRQDGVIRTGDGERVLVRGAAFPGGRGPVGRCAGIPVTFELASDDAGKPRALAVAFLEADVPRRARMRTRR